MGISFLSSQPVNEDSMRSSRRCFLVGFSALMLGWMTGSRDEHQVGKISASLARGQGRA